MKFWVIWLFLLVAVVALLDSQAREEREQEEKPQAPAVQVVTEPAPAQTAVEPVEAQRAQAEQTWVPVRVAARNLSVISLQAIPMVVLLGAVGWAIRRRNVWYAKEDGRMPFFGVDNQVAKESLSSFHAAQVAEASQPLPVHTYAPHGPHTTLTWAPRNHQSGEWVEPPAATVDVHKAPTFAELVAAGTIGPGQPLYLGMGAEGPLTGTWKSVYSAGIGGLQGSGKTWTAVLLILQALAGGANVLVIDPHDGDPESLGSRLKPVHHLLAAPVASNPTDTLKVAAKVRAELARRASGQSADRRLWLLVVDEWTALQRGEVGAEIASVVEAVTQEGRKLEIDALLNGQRWSSTRGGGNDLRNTLTSAFVHRMRPEDARMLTGLRAEQLPKDMLQLAPGECYVQTTAGDFTRVVMPRMSDTDVAAFAARLTSSGTPSAHLPESSRASSGLLPGRGVEDALTPSSGGSSTASSDSKVAGQGANDPRYHEVRGWVLQGVSHGEIRDRLVGGHVTGGRTAQEANARITAILQAIALEALYAHGEAGGETGS